MKLMMCAVSVMLLMLILVASVGVSPTMALAQTENLTEQFLQENPDFEVTVPPDVFEGFLKTIKNQTETREGIPPVKAPSPVRFDVPPEGILAANIPYPTVNQIQIEVTGVETDLDGTRYAIPWSGSIMYGDGDITSYDGDGSTYFTVDCLAGNPYSVSFQKSGEDGVLDMTITNHEHDILDTDKTEAAYGIVGLRGTC